MLAESTGIGGDGQVVWNTSAFQLLIISATGGFTGLFEYAPVPALGNLIASIAPAAGTDPYGNAYLPGVVAYETAGVNFATQVSAGKIQWWNAPGPGGPWTANGPSILQANGIAIESGAIGAGTPIVLQMSPETPNGVAILNGSLGLAEEAVPSSALTATAPQLFGNTSGHIGYVSDAVAAGGHGDGNTYDTGRLTLRLVSPFTINSVFPQTIFSKNLGIGTYEVEVWAVVLNSVAADGAGFAFAFSGTATGLMDYEAINTAGGIAYVASNILTTQGNSFGVAGNQRIEFRMTITVTVAGLLAWTGLELVGGNTVAVIQGSRMRICPVVAV